MITTFQRNISQHCWVQHVAYVWPPCCDVLWHVGSNLKVVKFFIQHLWTLHDVVVVWPGSCNNVAPRHAHLFDFQLVTWRHTLQQDGQKRATCCAQQCWSVAFKRCHRLAGTCKYWANLVGICCVEMLLSFDRGLTLMFYSSISTWWLSLSIVGPPSRIMNEKKSALLVHALVVFN